MFCFIAGAGTRRYNDQGMLVDAAVAGVVTLRNDDQVTLVDAAQGHSKKKESNEMLFVCSTAHVFSMIQKL